ncbi:phage tail protein [Limnobaculum zhutongyuii]|uniref:Phage tail protein n=1 Tax=Limnobaculum zhutongyuii TaxID=2498113 RepID=A0A411WQE5_9GAMM|nr:phage tail sheath subtilisin-like domain-containing protein [Limnobaculum zhutongyuii]QBH98412.1 phage tail protein [Limnobaculum zhutongyuii]TQS89690.1 phage tail protein [Limnobaculum zhutongyuii]
MSMSFNTVPADIQVPLFFAEMDNSAANTSQDSSPVLLIGHALSDSSIEPNTLTIMPSADRAKKLAGRGSQLARMVEGYRNVDPFGEVWVIAVPETASEEAATGEITITGTALSAGVISLYISSVRVSVPVVAQDEATAVAASIAATVNANLDVAVTAQAEAGKVTLTAKNKGISGNELPVSVNYRGTVGGEETPSGVNIAIQVMSGGVGVPDLTAVIATMGDEPFDFIGLPFNDAATLALMGAEMNDDTGRWSYARQLYGHVYTARISDLSNLVAFGSTLNDPHLSVAGYESDIQTAADELTAIRVARNAVFIRNDPARPTQTGVLNGALPAVKGKCFALPEQQSLLTHGIGTAYAEGNTLRIQRDITTYQRNAYGVSDNSYFDSETLHTSAYVLRRLKSVITSKYGRHKLANDGTRFGPGQAIVTPKVIKGELCAVYKELERAGIVENFELFKQYLIVERNADNPNRLDVLFPPDYVNQLRVFALINQFRLQYKEAA